MCGVPCCCLLPTLACWISVGSTNVLSSTTTLPTCFPSVSIIHALSSICTLLLVALYLVGVPASSWHHLCSELHVYLSTICYLDCQRACINWHHSCAELHVHLAGVLYLLCWGACRQLTSSSLCILLPFVAYFAGVPIISCQNPYSMLHRVLDGGERYREEGGSTQPLFI